MDKKNSKIYAGFITYGKSTAKYLPYFLTSLKEQSLRGVKILAVDNSEVGDNLNYDYLKNNFPEIEIIRAGENLGFAKAFNLMIKRAGEAGARYFLTLNPDMILEPGMIAELVKIMDKDGSLGSASPKILKWDFSGKAKTEIIDSCGIKLLPGLRFIDAGQNSLDTGRLNIISILGPSGAAAFYRLSALEKVRQDGQYFDELMFMYKEDCDLAYRLFLAGFKSTCAAAAVAYHVRSAAGGGEKNLQVALNRKHKSRQEKKWAFLNQQIIFIKYWRRQSFKEKLNIIFYELKMIVFILMFERYLIGELVELRKIKEKIKIYE
ncbi:MAG: glycosyltransferase family 2 protein [bacterium]|nr:glycosyltransferase family 2 protein [bacterium]